jgi:hypothetical protein
LVHFCLGRDRRGHRNGAGFKSAQFSGFGGGATSTWFLAPRLMHSITCLCRLGL